MVERNVEPQGVKLVNSKVMAKRGANDLVELAMEIEKVIIVIKLYYNMQGYKENDILIS